jgi:hypothetical protein
MLHVRGIQIQIQMHIQIHIAEHIYIYVYIQIAGPAHAGKRNVCLLHVFQGGIMCIMCVHTHGIVRNAHAYTSDDVRQIAAPCANGFVDRFCSQAHMSLEPKWLRMYTYVYVFRYTYIHICLSLYI